MRRAVVAWAGGAWLVGVLASGLPGCSSKSPAGGPAGDAAGTTEGGGDVACIQTQNPSICAPIVRCAPCAYGGHEGDLCGEAPQLGGCDMEGAVCIGACDVPCTCTGGFWRCDFPDGEPCLHGSCIYLQNYGGGGADSFTCCPVDGGASRVWMRGCAGG